MAKVKVTNPRYNKTIKVGSIIEIPDCFVSDFLMYKHGEVVKQKAEKKPQKNKAIKSTPKNKAE